MMKAAFGDGTSRATLAAAFMLAAAGCTGEHQSEEEDDLVPPMNCTFAPELKVEVPDTRSVRAIGVHDQHVYLLARTAVLRVPKVGGVLEEVTAAPVPLTPLTVPEVSDGGYIYKADHLAQEIIRISKDGSTRTSLGAADVASDSFAMAIYGHWLYWTSSSGTVYKVPKDGALAPIRLASFGSYDDDDYRGLIAVDADGVFFLAGLAGRRSSDSDALWLARACR